MRPFGCGIFIKYFLSGSSLFGSLSIDPGTGATQSDIFQQYKLALIRTTAMDRAIRAEEKIAIKEKRPYNPDNVDNLFHRYLTRLPYKSGCTYHSFVTYFFTIQKLGWVEFTGVEEPSSLQDNYPEVQPGKYFRLTSAGMSAPDYLWANPHRTLYG